ncbi:TetR/AcrR family transcriptional regulator [Nocardioides sp. cx-173]|uniref:TetR/AcrR family transcriptional regulator n=1 Tax=Nocardioides sp. cx-173 TaxID=2898796 RepID=UPI001E5CCB83|nr:TetR/AcrR family transcriptional regulator [Nocardioides sp. cx-173]MCD4523904.1 TetR/AcrR family transcriptional regulator [Nocardioides sp. cx-173]UGB41777.1 TetR/AcrR family transcriptional regulator [Nocardioides sp. cx-173]
MSENEQPDVRRRLLEQAAQLLGEEGPAALTTRRLAREAGTSTMAVYTHFGGMPALVRAVVAEGFRRLVARVAEVEPTDDPLDDLRRAAVAYRQHALADPQMYAVMFGSASLGGYRLHDDELDIGLAAFGQLVDLVRRAMAGGRLREDDPAAVAGQFWSALHGYVMLELSGFHQVVEDPEAQLLWPMLAHLVEGLRADGARAR